MEANNEHDTRDGGRQRDDNGRHYSDRAGTLPQHLTQHLYKDTETTFRRDNFRTGDVSTIADHFVRRSIMMITLPILHFESA